MTQDAFGIVGTRVAGYYVERVVADGSFATIYRARDALGSELALKLLRIPALDPEQRAEFMRLFRAEAELSFRLAASVDSLVRPLRVDLLATPKVPFAPYLALEWLEGISLATLIEQRSAAGEPPIPLRKLVRLLTPVARTLERAHRFASAGSVSSMVHGDLKPENLFIAQRGAEELVKLSGFGSDKLKRAARQLAGDPGQDPQSPLSPAYAAPERWAPRQYGQPGPWTDVWGLALTLLEAMAGRPVLTGDLTVLERRALDPQRRPTPRTEGVQVSGAVEAVFARAMALQPEARPSDAGVFWDELVHALQTSSAPPRAPQPSAALQRMLAMDLEFDPTSGSTPQLVPELELAPVSVRTRPSREPPLEAPIYHAATSVLDLNDVSDHGAALDLDLDLPASDPISRRVANASTVLALTDAARSSSAPPGRASSSLNAVRDFADAAPGSAKISLERRESPLPKLEAASPRASSSRPALRAGRSERAPLTLTRPRSEQPLALRFRVPILLFAGALLVAVADPIYAIVSGEVLEILGLRLSLIAGALLLASIGLSIREWTMGTKSG